MNPVPIFLPFFMFLNSNQSPLLWRDQYRQADQLLSFHTEASVQSSHLSTDGMYLLLQGGVVDEALKNSLRASGPGQRLGGDWNTQLRYTNLNDSAFGGKGWGYTLAFSNRLIAESRYHGDAFNLLLDGNAPTAGETLQVGDAFAQSYMYQQVEVGMVKSWVSEKASASMAFSVGFVNANWYRGFDAPSGTWYTDPIGSYIDLEAEDWRFETSNPEENGFFFPNGTGVSFSFQYEWHWKKRHMLAFSANDVGFIRWSQKSSSSNLDGSIRWEGVVLPNITNISEGFFEDYADSLQGDYLTENPNRAFSTALPMQFNISYGYNFQSLPLACYGQIRWRPLSPWLPLSTLGLLWSPEKIPLRLAGTLGYGGYGTFQAGLDLGFNFGKGYTLQLRTGNLEGLIPNSFSTGLGAGITFTKYFVKP